MSDNVGESLKEIGHFLVLTQPTGALSTLMLVEIEPGYLSVNVFDDFGPSLHYRMFSPVAEDISELSDLLFKLFYADPATPRWRKMEFFIRGEDFRVRFRYPDEINPERDMFDRRDELLAP